MPWTEHPKVTSLRRRHRIVDVVIETLDGFRRHLTGRNSAVLTYYGFLTLFPLFLAATTILGIVLENKREWRDDLVGSAAESVPFIGNQIAEGQIGTSLLALAIGLVAALWGSMKAFVGVQLAYDDTWEIPIDERASFVTQRTRALIGLAVIGGSQVATVVLASIVGQAGLPRLGQVVLILGGLAINVGVAAAMYRFLTSADPTWSMVWAGAILTGAVYTVIQMFGAKITTELAKDDTYGELGSVLALLSWLSLHAIVNLFGVELNAARHRLEQRGSEADQAPLMVEQPSADA